MLDSKPKSDNFDFDDDLTDIKAITPQPGNADDPKTFIGRRELDEKATQLLLQERSNLLLTDPRRMGKTYWLKHFCAETKEFRAVYIDYEGVDSIDGFLIETAKQLRSLQNLPKKSLNFMKGMFKNIDSMDIGPITIKPGARVRSAADLLASMVKHLDAATAGPRGKPVLICMDEVPLAVYNIAKASSGNPQNAAVLLQTLRRMRLETKNIKWIVTGSIGFHHVLDSAGSTFGELGDLRSLPLGPLTPQDAAVLTKHLLASISTTLEPGTVKTMVERTGGMPFYIQEIASCIAENFECDPITAADVEAAYRGYFDDPDRSHPTRHLEQRIEIYYGKDSELAYRILDATAKRSPQPISQLKKKEDTHNGFIHVLQLLVRDHYLEEEDNMVRWKYEALQQVWLRGRFIS